MDSNAIKQPSIKQMVVRMDGVHMRILRANHSGQHIETRCLSSSALRGLRTAAGTLRHWGCLVGAGLGDGLTATGEELLSAAQSKFKGGAA